MGLGVNTNIPSLTAYRLLSSNNRSLGKTIRNLSSGLRINSAADDPAGLTIVEKMRGQITGLNRASMNAQDGINMFQTAEGALVETTSILHRMRELSVQASNGTLTQNDRQEIQKEVVQLRDEIDRISTSTEFNTKKLLDGSASAIWSTDKPDKLEAVVNGKVIEGNYKIDINRTGGEAQVWKSNVMNLSEATTVSAAVTVLTSGATFEATAVVTNSANLTADYNVGYQFVKGQAAEIYGNAATAITSISLAGTTNARFDGAAGTKTNIDGFVLTADVTITVNDGSSGTTITYEAGTVLTDDTLDSFDEMVAAQDTRVTASAHLTNGKLAIDLTVKTANATVTFNAYAKSLFGIDDITSANSSLASNAGTVTAAVTGSLDAESVDVWRVTIDSTVSAATTQDFKFTISDGTNTATVNFGLWDSTGMSAGGTLGADVNFYLSEKQVLDKVNSALTTATVNAQAEVDNDGYLNIIGNSSATALTIAEDMGDGLDAATDTTLEVFGFTAGTQVQTADNKIRLAVNDGAVVTATISVADFNAATTSNARAAIVESAINAALISGSYTTANLIDVFASDDDALIMNTKKVGDGAEIDVVFGLQSSGDFLDKVGWTIQDHAQGDDQGYTMQAWDRNVSTTFAVSAMTTHNWNTKEYATAGATNDTWTAVASHNVDLIESLATASLSLTFGSAVSSTGGGTLQVNYTASYDSFIALGSTQLKDLSNFIDGDGNNILDEAQELTIYGNEKEVTILIDKQDTLDQLSAKIKDAVTSANGLDMGLDPTVNANAANYVSEGEGVQNTQEAVEGTMVVHSTFIGEKGQISFAGNEDLLNALGFAEVQQSEDSAMTVTISDAHDNTVNIARFGSDSTYANPVIENAIAGVDVYINPKVDVTNTWNDTTKKFEFSSSVGQETLYLHLVDNSVDPQIGANEGQLMNAYIGQMDSKALGIKGLNLADQQLAQNAITTIDNAISKVSSERANMGAYINRLEHTINNLGVQSENLEAARSGIEDLDVAKAMVDFTKYQTVNQLATAMLAQANQLPSMVMQLIQ